jgi:acetyltransferase-like isoleucine patch superfamily enzyme
MSQSNNILSRIFRKVGRTFQQTLAVVLPGYGQSYYTNQYQKAIPNFGAGSTFKGKADIADFRELIVGSNVTIGKNVQLQNAGGLYLGDGTEIGNNVTIITTTADIGDNFSAHEMHIKKPVIIGRNVQIGAGATIHPGITIGEGAVVEAGAMISVDILPIDGKSDPSKSVSKTGKEMGENLFFLVSTGRSGTNAFSHIFSDHSDIRCIHEQHFMLNRISTEYAHGIRKEATVRSELEAMFLKSSTIKNDTRIYGESDLKNSNLISIYHQLMPQAKYIWLIRRAEDFVASAYGRGWFDDREYCTADNIIYSEDKVADDSIFDFYRMEYAWYRINGGKTSALNEEEWNKMTSFERCCWYWNYWNTLIETQLANVPSNQWIMVRLEELKDSKQGVFELLGVKEQQVEVKAYNKAYHATVKNDQWTTEQQEIFNRWCAEGMQKWYS